MDLFIENANFNISQTFLCGQCFRWRREENGDFSGIAFGKALRLSQSENGVTLHNITDSDASLWREYFDLDTDYGAVIEQFFADETLKKAACGSSGIRILRQEPFETLISFIISQNNNIPRITGIIDRLCESFGERIDGGFSFPTPKRMARLSESDLAPLRAGFRNRYIIDAAQKIHSGEVDLEGIKALSYEDGKAELKKIVGVGEKVADCVMLFGYHKLDAFPKDVWVKRMLAELYPNGLPECIKGYEGIAQQYLFDYVRNNNGLNNKTNTANDNKKAARKK